MDEINIVTLTALLLISAYLGSVINILSLQLPLRLFYQWKQAYSEQPSEELAHINIIKADKPPKLFCYHKTRYAKFNIPLLGYLFTIGQYKNGRHAIYSRRFIVEALTVTITTTTIGIYGITFESFLLLVLFYGLLVVSLIDLDHQLLPDIIVLPLLWLGLIINYNGLFTSLHSAILGTVFGYLSLWSVFHIYRLLTGKIGLGHGDFKLFALLGAWFGWQQLPFILFIASTSGTLVGVLLVILRKKRLTQTFSFGPHLALAGGVAYLLSKHDYENYLHLLQWQ